MKKILLPGLCVILLIPILSLSNWVYYRDKKPFICPISYNGEIPIRNDVYGDGRFGAPRRGKRLHKGLDISAPLGSEVMASKGGRVELRFQKDGMGKYVIISHPGEYATLYGHLSEYGIKDNTRVRQGDIIGYVGKTGNARYNKIKAHLHFEIIRNGQRLDPLLFLE